MNILKTTAKPSAIFLVTVLVLGTISSFTPSFIIGINAQSEPYYGYNSYKPTEYSPNYADREYNSYEQEYGTDDERKSYENNKYQTRGYPSYQPDYKPEYQPYGGKDDSYKSTKDSSSKKSVSINKLNCINNNVNINGNNAGNVSIGNKGQAAYAEEGYSGAYSSGGYGIEGYSKQDKGFDCVINNNNINNNFGAGNATDGNVTDTCEECFLDALGPTLLAQFEQRYLAILQLDITEYCDASIQNEIESGISVSEIVDRIQADLNLAGIELDSATLAELEACLFELFG